MSDLVSGAGAVPASRANSRTAPTMAENEDTIRRMAFLLGPARSRDVIATRGCGKPGRGRLTRSRAGRGDVGASRRHASTPTGPRGEEPSGHHGDRSPEQRVQGAGSLQAAPITIWRS